MADDDFSHRDGRACSPTGTSDPMSWFDSRAGTSRTGLAPRRRASAIDDMLRFRADKATLFIVVDEVSQYVHQDTGRMLKLQSFVSELGQRLKGKVWLLVTGQQKLEDGGDASILGKLKDRFPAKLRVHLARHQHPRRRPQAPAREDRRGRRRSCARCSRSTAAICELFAYDCEEITEDDFVEVYPMLPGHIDLILQITSALRTRSSRSQGDDQAIRGLLQLLGELFRDQKLADRERRRARHARPDLRGPAHRARLRRRRRRMARILAHCADARPDAGGRAAARAVALLELIQEQRPDRRPSWSPRASTTGSIAAATASAVHEALEELRRANLLGYSEKHGYKIQSSAGEEWERERRDIGVPPRAARRADPGARSSTSSPTPERPKLDGRPFPWLALFSDGRRGVDVQLEDPRDPAAVTDRLPVPDDARRARPRRPGSTAPARTTLEQPPGLGGRRHRRARRGRPRARQVDRDGRSATRAARESLHRGASAGCCSRRSRAAKSSRPGSRRAVDAAWLDGRMYFRGKPTEPRELGGAARAGAGARLRAGAARPVPALRRDPGLQRRGDAAASSPSSTRRRPSSSSELGLLELEHGKYVPDLQRRRAAPRARAHHQRRRRHRRHAVRPLRRPAVRLRARGRARVHRGPAARQQDPDPVRGRRRDLGGARRRRARRPREGARLQERRASTRSARIRSASRAAPGSASSSRTGSASSSIARTTRSPTRSAPQFPRQMARLREVFEQPAPAARATARRPPRSIALEAALDSCYRLVRQTEPTVQEVARQLDALTDGIDAPRPLRRRADRPPPSTPSATADDVARYQLAQLLAIGHAGPELAAAGERITAQLAGETPWRGIDAARRRPGAGPRRLPRGAPRAPRPRTRRPPRPRARRSSGATGSRRSPPTRATTSCDRSPSALDRPPTIAASRPRSSSCATASSARIVGRGEGRQRPARRHAQRGRPRR